MSKDSNEEIKKMQGANVLSIINESVSDKGTDISILFSGEIKIQTSFWRFLKEGVRISIFDHKKSYGTSKEINAVEELRDNILKEVILDAEFAKLSGDIKLIFHNGAVLEIFNFTSNEVWEIEFGNGFGQYSNYI
jgi:hypothetical protein